MGKDYLASCGETVSLGVPGSDLPKGVTPATECVVRTPREEKHIPRFAYCAAFARPHFLPSPNTGRKHQIRVHESAIGPPSGWRFFTVRDNLFQKWKRFFSSLGNCVFLIENVGEMDSVVVFSRVRCNVRVFDARSGGERML